MTQLTNTGKLILFAFAIQFFSCSSERKGSQEVDSTIVSTKVENNSTESKALKQMAYSGVKVSSVDGQKKEYDLIQANEIAKNLTIIVSNDSVIVPGYCSYKVHEDKYEKEKMKYNVEGLIIEKLHLDRIKVISNYNGTNEGCQRPFSTLVLSDDRIIFFDGGYFYEMEQSSNTAGNYHLSKSLGVVGDTRQTWDWQYSFDGKGEDAYKDFLSRFPYGAEGLETEIVKNDSFDSEKDIRYKWTADKLEIIKNIPVGTIRIVLTAENEKTRVEYSLLFPSEGVEFGG